RAVTTIQAANGVGHSEEGVDDSAATLVVSPDSEVWDSPTGSGADGHVDHDDGVQPTQRCNKEAGSEWIIRCERTRRYLRRSVRVLPDGTVGLNTASYLLVPLFLAALGYDLDAFENYRGIAWPPGWRVTELVNVIFGFGTALANSVTAGCSSTMSLQEIGAMFDMAWYQVPEETALQWAQDTGNDELRRGDGGMEEEGTGATDTAPSLSGIESQPARFEEFTGIHSGNIARCGGGEGDGVDAQGTGTDDEGAVLIPIPLNGPPRGGVGARAATPAEAALRAELGRELSIADRRRLQRRQHR
ncbi:unnamed protein product, partial [Sphacelaria rigidula]